MTGTIINVVTIVIGSLLGVFFGKKLPDRLRQTVVSGLGLFVLAYGVATFLDSNNEIMVLGGILIGVLLGEWWKIEDGLQHVGGLLERLVTKTPSGSESKFVRGFFSASLLFCIGPIAILGSLQDGLSGDYKLLAIKAIMDGFASLAFASTLGIGVLFSSLSILVYQGAISLLAHQLQPLITPEMMTEMTATGGVLLVGIAVSSLLELKKIRLGSFLPALVITPLIVAFFAWLNH
jgi:uncharacterized membrane protein YqgA involved in biofilm formation